MRGILNAFVTSRPFLHRWKACRWADLLIGVRRLGSTARGIEESLSQRGLYLWRIAFSTSSIAPTHLPTGSWYIMFDVALNGSTVSESLQLP